MGTRIRETAGAASVVFSLAAGRDAKTEAFERGL